MARDITKVSQLSIMSNYVTNEKQTIQYRVSTRSKKQRTATSLPRANVDLIINSAAYYNCASLLQLAKIYSATTCRIVDVARVFLLLIYFCFKVTKT